MSLKKRSRTAVFFVSIVLAGIFIHAWTFALVFAAVTALCLWEYAKLVNTAPPAWRTPIAIGLGLLPYLWVASASFFPGRIPGWEVLGWLLVLVVFFLLALELAWGHPNPFQQVSAWVFGVFYIGIPMAMYAWLGLKDGVYHRDWVLGLILLNWVNDTAAYLLGSRFGKHKLFPRISPQKSWEGSLGALAVTLFIGWLMGFVFPSLATLDWMILSLLTVLFGGIGDLAESMLKRSTGVKDTGGLLPGHGGILDRFDGLIFTIPFAVAYLLWFSRLPG